MDDPDRSACPPVSEAVRHRPGFTPPSPPQSPPATERSVTATPRPRSGQGTTARGSVPALLLLLPWHPRPLLFISRPHPQHCHRLQGTLPRSLLLFPTPFPLTYLATHFDLCKYQTRHRQMLETPECCGRRPSMDDRAQICHSENSCLRASKPRS